MGSGNGLVPSGNKPLPDPMLTQFYVALHHYLLSYNELNFLNSNIYNFFLKYSKYLPLTLVIKIISSENGTKLDNS